MKFKRIPLTGQQHQALEYTVGKLLALKDFMMGQDYPIIEATYQELIIAKTQKGPFIIDEGRFDRIKKIGAAFASIWLESRNLTTSDEIVGYFKAHYNDNDNYERYLLEHERTA